MGNRRIGRKRLYGVEKQGQSIDLDSGIGIEDAIIRATQHRQGQELITEILVDLGTSAAAIAGGSAAEAAVGKGVLAAHLTRLTVAKFGVVTEIRAVVLEDPEPAAVDQLDIWVNASAIVADTDVGTGASGTAGPADLATTGQDVSVAYDTNVCADGYLYIANATSHTGGDTFTAGKLAIYIHGFVVPSDL